MTRAQDTKPTEAEWATARKWVQEWFDDESLAEEPTSGLIARALASQRADIHARHEAVARHLDYNADGKGMPAAGSYDRGAQIAQTDAAARIRQVATS